MYKKRDRHKEEMKDFFEQQATKKFRDMMEDFFTNPDPEVMKRLTGASSVLTSSVAYAACTSSTLGALGDGHTIYALSKQYSVNNK